MNTLNPTEALLNCADLSRGADEGRATCHVCLERRSYSDSGANDVVTIAATDGTVVFRYDFDLCEYPGHWLQDIVGGLHAPGSAFPSRGSASWGVAVKGDALELVAHTRSGKPRSKQPDPIVLTRGVGPLLSAWERLTWQPGPLSISLADSDLAECVEALDGCAVAGLRSEGGVLVVTAGPSIAKQPWRAKLSTASPEFAPRFVGVEPLWQAIDVHAARELTLSRDDVRAPILFTSGDHVAVVMPTT